MLITSEPSIFSVTAPPYQRGIYSYKMSPVTKDIYIRPQTKIIAQSPVTHDHLSKVISVVEKGLVLIYYMAASWRAHLALVGKGLPDTLECLGGTLTECPLGTQWCPCFTPIGGSCR